MSLRLIQAGITICPFELTRVVSNLIEVNRASYPPCQAAIPLIRHSGAPTGGLCSRIPGSLKERSANHRGGERATTASTRLYPCLNGLSSGDFHFSIAAGRDSVDRCRNLVEVQSHNRPLGSAQHDERYSAACKVLLVAHVLIGGQEYVEPGPIRFGQQIAVGQRISSSLFRFCDRVARKKPGNALGRYVVKENAHRRENRRQGQGQAHPGCGRQIQVRR